MAGAYAQQPGGPTNPSSIGLNVIPPRTGTRTTGAGQPNLPTACKTKSNGAKRPPPDNASSKYRKKIASHTMLELAPKPRIVLATKFSTVPSTLASATSRGLLLTRPPKTLVFGWLQYGWFKANETLTLLL